MKYATLLLGLVIVLASIAAAQAKDARKCYRDARELGFTVADSKRICAGKLKSCEVATPAEAKRNGCFRE